MTGTFTVRADELSSSFIDMLKLVFKDKEIEISIHEKKPIDETEYFFCKDNISYLEKITSDIDSGTAVLCEHELK